MLGQVFFLEFFVGDYRAKRKDVWVRGTKRKQEPKFMWRVLCFHIRGFKKKCFKFSSSNPFNVFMRHLNFVNFFSNR